MKKRSVLVLLCVAVLSVGIVCGVTTANAFAANGEPEWQIYGEIPSYVSKGEEVMLPTAFLTVAIANGEKRYAPELSVTDPDGVALTVSPDKYSDDNTYDVYDVIRLYNRYPMAYAFKTAKDGVYSLRYTAVVGSVTYKKAFEIRAGDFTPPDFKVKTSHVSAMREKDVFLFEEIFVLSQEDMAALRYGKALKDPNGEIVWEIDGAGEDFRTATMPPNEENGYVLAKTGKYTVRYEVWDARGNSTTIDYDIAVRSRKFGADEDDGTVAQVVHRFSDDVKTTATCTQSGYTYRSCKACLCEEILKEVPALGHTPSEWKEDAVRRYRKCTVCGAELEEVSKKTGCGGTVRADSFWVIAFAAFGAAVVLLIVKRGGTVTS